MKTISSFVTIAIAALISPNSFAQGDSIVGDWALSLDEGRSQRTGVLTIEASDAGVAAYLHGGPVPMSFDGNDIQLEVDWRDGFDLIQIAILSGTVDGDLMSGESGPGDSASFFGGQAVTPGTWSATRIHNDRTAADQAPMPVDLSGIWANAAGRATIRKMIYERTPEGQARTDNYQDMDDPALRCASYGVFRATAFPFVHEIVQTEQQILLAVGADFVRRIYLDGREIPDDSPPTELGYSVGHWDGSTLIVETSGLTANFMSAGFQYSRDMRLVEHFYLDDEGLLYRDVWVHDPENYVRPLFSRYIRSRQPDTMIIRREGCDPYGFFRSLAVQDKLEEWWSRAEFRR